MGVRKKTYDEETTLGRPGDAEKGPKVASEHIEEPRGRKVSVRKVKKRRGVEEVNLLLVFGVNDSQASIFPDSGAELEIRREI